MDLSKMIAELRSEREALDQALAALDRIARSQGKRRGRPPAWLSLAVSEGEAPKKRVVSPEVRKKMAEAQKKRWAAYRKEQTTTVK